MLTGDPDFNGNPIGASIDYFRLSRSIQSQRQHEYLTPALTQPSALAVCETE